MDLLLLVLGLVVLLVAGFVPMLAYAAALYWLDRYEKEPFWLLALVFLWGAIPAVILAIIPQVGLDAVISRVSDPESIRAQLGMNSVVAPLTEELAKGVAVFLVFLLCWREFDSLLDGVIYGSLVGFGFAATENVFYFLGALTEHGFVAFLFLAFLRSVVFGLNHAFFTSLTGIGFALARHGGSAWIRAGSPLAGLLAAMIAHGLHNLGATLTGQSMAWLGFSFTVDWLGITGVFVLVLVTLSHERRWIWRELTEEVEAGVLSRRELKTLISSWRRMAELWLTFFRNGPATWWMLFRFYHTATKLAFEKRHRRELKDDPQAGSHIDRLRGEVAELRKGLARLVPDA